MNNGRSQLNQMRRPFVFFDLGQTLIDERDFISYLDAKFRELLNGFGARIDQRNYCAVRDSIIRDRKIGYGSVNELVMEICKILSPLGYEKTMVKRLLPEIKLGRRDLFHFFDDAEPMLQDLSKICQIGLIANQSEDIRELLEKSGLGRFFMVQLLSTDVKLKKPDHRIFELALTRAGRRPNQCVMVGDRLDTDICPANKIGMLTIRTTNSLFALQMPRHTCEYASHTVSRLSEIPEIIESIIT